MVFDALVGNRVEWPETPVFGEGAKDNTRGRVCSPWMLRLLTICHFKLLATSLPGKPPELMNPVEKQQCNEHARRNILALIAGETDEIPYHIACSATTLSEIVIPIFDNNGEVRAVLDVDSDLGGIFDAVDQAALELLADDVSIVFSGKSHH